MIAADAAPDLLMDEDDATWLAEFQAALDEQPAELGQIKRIQGALSSMGYQRPPRSVEEIDWAGLAKYFWDPAVPYPWTPEQLAEG